MTSMARYLAPQGAPEMSFSQLKLALEPASWAAAAALDCPKSSLAQGGIAVSGALLLEPAEKHGGTCAHLLPWWDIRRVLL